MKKVFTMILALVLVLSMSITAFAAENNSQEVKGTYQATEESSTVYAVDVTWGSMEFTYDVPADVWNGEEHKYESGGEAQWKHNEGANIVTVTNRSNAAVNVAVTTDTGSSGITASVTNSTFQLGNAADGATTEIAGTATEGTATITLSGVLADERANKSVIGSVTVTITAVDTLPTPTDEDINAAVEALKAGETVVLYNVSPENHAVIVAALDESSEGALINSSEHGIMDTYSLKDSFSDALAAWTDGMTLTMLGDATDLTDYITTTAKGLTLDLNGHTLASADTWTLKVDAASELTIRDGKGTGYIDGPVIAGWNSSSGCGTILLESGTLEEVRVNGIFTMTGGSVRNEDSVAIQVNNEPDTVLITGGEIYGSTYGVWITSGNVIITGTAKVSGGTGIFKIFDDVPTITGGTFSHDPSAYVDTENYTVTQNDDGTWRVTAK